MTLRTATMAAAIAAFCAHQRAWLELELQDEQEQEKLQHKANGSNSSAPTTTRNGSNSDSHAESSTSSVGRSNVLQSLEVSDVSIGLYGRTVIRFVAIESTGVAATDDSLSEEAKARSKKQLSSSTPQRLLPAHRFTTGDEVEIRCFGKKKQEGNGKSNRAASNNGVVSAVTDSSISIALFPSRSSHRDNRKKDDVDGDDTENQDFSNPPYSLLARSNVEVHRKLLVALNELESKGVDHPVCGRIVQALFDPSSIPSGSSHNSTVNGTPEQTAAATARAPALQSTSSLDDSQKEAIAFALSSNQPIALIHGPPGTGKTTTLAELVQQAVQIHGYKVLVTAPSNVAVDNILSRLVQKSSSSDTEGSSRRRKQKTHRSSDDSTMALPRRPLNVVRLGHPARLQPAILPYCLEALVHNADGTEIVNDVRTELQSHLATLAGPRYAKHGRVDKRLAYSEVKALRKELREREEKVIDGILDRAQVVLATCVGAGNTKVLQALQFDLVVIDEAAQALEAACWIPALQARSKLILAGDHLQLPPTIKSNVPAVQAGLGKTMFERVIEMYGDSTSHGKPGRVSRMLKVQYRMNELIANWASQALYGGELMTHESVKSRTLAQLEGTTTAVAPDSELDDDTPPLLLLDTAGCHMYESTNAAGSRYNEGEARLVVQHVRKLLAMGVEPDQIAVITPYNGQVEILRLALLPEAPKLQIRSVDGFQGGEREAVVLSLVRSSQRGGSDGIGFLRDDRRLNVAVTRAKRHCCVVCDTDTVSQSPFIKNLIQWIEEYGEQRSAVEMWAENDVGDDSQMEADLLLAELELDRLASPKHRKADPVDVDKRHLTLHEKISTFQAKAVAGDILWMSAELTKLDRKLVHEIAEELGLEHQSEGVEGVNRRIKLRVPNNPQHLSSEDASSTASNLVSPVRDDEQVELEEAEVDTISHTAAAPIACSDDIDAVNETTNVLQRPSPSVFADLQSDTDDEAEVEEAGVGEPSDAGLNNVLGNLAKERAERERQSKQRSVEKPQPKAKKGQKLGGTKKSTPANTTDDGMDDLDDLAFLDAQIDKVQNSHGRKVEGTGKAYRTIVNGVLLAKPAAPPKKRNDSATAALSAKLREAKAGRKAKPKK